MLAGYIAVELPPRQKAISEITMSDEELGSAADAETGKEKPILAAAW